MEIFATMSAEVTATVQHVAPCTPDCVTCYPTAGTIEGTDSE